MKTSLNNNLFFSISKETMQEEAIKKIGRVLNDDELNIAKKGLEFGLMTDIDTVYNTILFDMIKKQ